MLLEAISKKGISCVLTERPSKKSDGSIEELARSASKKQHLGSDAQISGSKANQIGID